MGVLIKNEEGYPQLHIEYASCDGCQRCIAACQNDALAPQTRVDTGLRPSIGAACTNAQRHCASCVDHCPTQACILTTSGQPQIDNARCNGCGECLIQCDAHAITLAPAPHALAHG